MRKSEGERLTHRERFEPRFDDVAGSSECTIEGLVIDVNYAIFIPQMMNHVMALAILLFRVTLIEVVGVCLTPKHSNRHDRVEGFEGFDLVLEKSRKAVFSCSVAALSMFPR